MVDRRQLHDYGCSLKCSGRVVKPLKLYGEMPRFLPAIASEMGVKIDEVVVNHRARGTVCRSMVVEDVCRSFSICSCKFC